MTAVTLEPIAGGTANDFTISGTAATLTSSLTDTKITILLPEIESVEHTFNFRVKATSNGGAEKYTSNIKIL
jgi:hypothetical protein